MHLIFFRHADAEPAGPDIDDAARKLTPAGKKQAKRSARAIRRLGEKVELVLTSPLVRAAQTAKAAGKVWKGAAVEPLEALGSSFSATKLAARLNALQKAGTPCVCLVGHAPTLEDYLSVLIAGASPLLKLSKAGAACVDLPGRASRGGGELIWLLHRNQLAVLGGK